MCVMVEGIEMTVQEIFDREDVPHLYRNWGRALRKNRWGENFPVSKGLKCFPCKKNVRWRLKKFGGVQQLQR